MNLTDVAKIMPLTIPGRFANRFEAGRLLTKKIVGTGSTDALARVPAALKKSLIVAIPRGGVAVAQPLVQALGAELGLVFVKKLTPPDSHELAIGAVAEDGGLLVDEKSAKEFGADVSYIEKERARLVAELKRQRQAQSHPAVIKDRDVILVDDGMATGYTVRLAAEVLRRQGARTITVAVPVTSAAALELVGPVVNKVVALKVDSHLYAVGSHYVSFDPVTEVTD
ncbi:MAG: phosphoribosyltransferase family protein [Candidatus Andersenbacteria bacterium]